MHKERFIAGAHIWAGPALGTADIYNLRHEILQCVAMVVNESKAAFPGSCLTVSV